MSQTPDSVRPRFVMPRCWRHFFSGHRWWCRHCDRVTEAQFREVCEAWWDSQIDGSGGES